MEHIAVFHSGSPSPFPAPERSPTPVPFRPSVAVIVGVLTTMFSLTFLLLLYVRHCKRGATGTAYGGGGGGGIGLASGGGERRHSGVDRAVVESLPVFRFGSLRGEKEGLECAVCLSRFEAAESLRLLPKCRHGFHVECVDIWLDAHSTCPLCRLRVDPEDVLLFLPDPTKPSPRESKHDPSGGEGGGNATAVSIPPGRRISGRHSTGSLQIVVHRADPVIRRSTDLSGGGGIGCFETGRVRKDRLLLAAEEEREGFERRYGHRIVLDGDGMTAERWSELGPSDLLFLRSEMIITESGRFSAPHVGGGSRGVITGRSLSEIAGVGRRLAPSRLEEEHRTMSKWLGFAARRTARWLRGPSRLPDGNGPTT
ncbi:RING-H2 finger protein ATL43 [Typha latifolia]|uniref:RING-H2 finger protein ATL43 n=1 Tax=Typha latifolia TaxID=4733 RepID=UPI003C2ADAF0